MDADEFEAIKGYKCAHFIILKSKFLVFGLRKLIYNRCYLRSFNFDMSLILNAS